MSGCTSPARARTPRSTTVPDRASGVGGPGRPGWHRIAGLVLVLAGLGVALSALWMTRLNPRKNGTGDLLCVLRLVFGSAVAAGLLLDAFTIALTARTQALTEGVGAALFGAGLLALDTSRGAAWVINLAVAEWVIGRPGRAHDVLRLRRVVATCFADDERSWRLMERVGMRREVYAVDDALHRSGRWLDGFGYALLAEEWKGTPARRS